MRSLAVIIISMPVVESSTSTGYSNRATPSRSLKRIAMTMAKPAPIRVSTLMKPPKPSVTIMP